EDTPQHTVGRAPTPTDPLVTEGSAPPPKGWSALTPKEPAPDQAKALEAPKVKSRHARKSRTHISRTAHRVQGARPRTSGVAKPHRPLALTPAAVRTSRRS